MSLDPSPDSGGGPKGSYPRRVREQQLKPGQAADRDALAGSDEARIASRAWWRRVPQLLIHPAGVFEALRESDPADVQARQEPVLLIVLLAGAVGVLATPTAQRLLDDGEYDGVLVAVWAFIGGGFYGFTVYLLGGIALWLGVRGMGSLQADWRSARHLLAFAMAPVALSLIVVLPLRLIAFGGDAFRSGGSDDGTAGVLAWALQGAFAVWALGLLLLGLRVVYGFTWARSAGTFALLALFLAAIVALPSAL